MIFESVTIQSTNGDKTKLRNAFEKRGEFLEFLLGLEDSQPIIFTGNSRVVFGYFNKRKSLDGRDEVPYSSREELGRLASNYPFSSYLLIGGQTIAELVQREIPLIGSTIPTIMPINPHDPFSDGKPNFNFISYDSLTGIFCNFEEFNTEMKKRKMNINEEIKTFSDYFFNDISRTL